MKPIVVLLVSALLLPMLAPQEPRRRGGGGVEKQEKQQEQEGEKPPKEPQNAVTRFFKKQTENLTQNVQGAWILFDYDDPSQPPMEGAAGGFMDFHDGFLSMILSIDTYEERLFRAREFTLVRTGAYRYRFDEMGTLQLVNVVSYTNQTQSGEMEREPSNQVFEYSAAINENLLELRNTDGVVITFRKADAGDFPDSAIRKLDSLRSGQARWEESEEERPR